MHLIPNHSRENEMATAMGISSVDQLFASIPKSLRVDGLNLPNAEPERRLVAQLHRTLSKNRTYANTPIFLGGGLKPQLVPAAVKAVAHRQELINAYTPYQPEVSQGLLQLLFEYQSLMADVTAMDVVNSSMYDGHTALGEAALMTSRCGRGRSRFLVSAALPWDKRSVLENYARGAGMTIDSFGFDAQTGEADLASLEAKLGPDVAGVHLENPNPFGVFETRAQHVVDLAHEAGALAVLGTDPTSLGIMSPPGKLGADIVVGEASCFGGAPAAGGPLLGLFATTEALVRKMPGRLIGATKDESGKRGYVMTLQAREQHIRRAKATSNICSNEALLANQAAIHLSMLGRRGLRDMGLQNLAAGQQLAATLEEAGLRPLFSGAFYNEVLTPTIEGLHDALLASGVHGGLHMSQPVEGTLWGSTPMHSSYDYDQLKLALASHEVLV